MNGNLTTIMAKDIELLNGIIRSDLDSKILLVRQISEYIINSGGKRVRPIVTLLCGRATGYTHGTLLHKMAAMIEYIHTATLLHDDVVDESSMRRGIQTANTIFGNAASVLVGDFIYTRSFQLMVESKSLALLQLMANSTNKISEGEVLQLLNIGNSKITQEDYFQVINSKTAVLFEAAARVGAIVANAGTPLENALGNYAKHLGSAFQIIDDILDYTGDVSVLGKNIGDDLLEGKVTLPLIYLLSHGSAHEMAVIKHAIEHPSHGEISTIVQIIKQSQAVDYCSNLAQQHIKIATQSLASIPESTYKTMLLDIAQSALERKH